METRKGIHPHSFSKHVNRCWLSCTSYGHFSDKAKQECKMYTSKHKIYIEITLKYYL
jgi:hypothetical protein